MRVPYLERATFTFSRLSLHPFLVTGHKAYIHTRQLPLPVRPMSDYPFRHSTYYTRRDDVYTTELPVRTFSTARALTRLTYVANEQ